MRKVTKAMLFSALLCPGAGHFVLKKPMTASALVMITLLASWRLVSTTFDRAQAIADQILAGEIAPNIDAITTALAQQAEDPMMGYMGMVLFICWFVGLIDVYRIGRQQQHKDVIESKG